MMMTLKETMKLSENLQGGGTEWWMAQGNNTARGPGNYPTLTVSSDDTGEFTFTVLYPAGVTFARTNAFGPKAGAQNPPDFWDQFTVSPGGTKSLVVKDANANKAGGPYAGGDYYYELHFSDGSTLDPVITNGGCCRTISTHYSIAYLAIGVVALVAIWVLLVRPMMARNTRVDGD